MIDAPPPAAADAELSKVSSDIVVVDYEQARRLSAGGAFLQRYARGQATQGDPSRRFVKDRMLKYVDSTLEREFVEYLYQHPRWPHAVVVGTCSVLTAAAFFFWDIGRPFHLVTRCGFVAVTLLTAVNAFRRRGWGSCNGAVMEYLEVSLASLFLGFSIAWQVEHTEVAYVKDEEADFRSVILSYPLLILVSLAAALRFRLWLFPFTIVVALSVVGFSGVAWTSEYYLIPPRLLSITGVGAVGILVKFNMEFFHRKQFERLTLLNEAQTQTKRSTEVVSDLVRTILPPSVLSRLHVDAPICDSFPEVTVVYADLVGFTSWSSGRAPAAIVELVNEIFTNFDQILLLHRVEKVKTIGDAYWCVAGICEDAIPSDAAIAATWVGLAMRDVVQTGLGKRNPDWATLSCRVGIHSGPALAGVVGISKRSYDVYGATNDVASKTESHGIPGEVHVTSATRSLFGTTFETVQRTSLNVDQLGTIAVWAVSTPQRTPRARSLDLPPPPEGTPTREAIARFAFLETPEPREQPSQRSKEEIRPEDPEALYAEPSDRPITRADRFVGFRNLVTSAHYNYGVGAVALLQTVYVILYMVLGIVSPAATTLQCSVALGLFLLLAYRRWGKRRTRLQRSVIYATTACGCGVVSCILPILLQDPQEPFHPRMSWNGQLSHITKEVHAVSLILLALLPGIGRKTRCGVLLGFTIAPTLTWWATRSQLNNALLVMAFYAFVDGTFLGYSLERVVWRLYVNAEELAVATANAETDALLCDHLLQQLLPACVVPRLTRGETVVDECQGATVLFICIDGLDDTCLTDPRGFFDTLNAIYCQYDGLVASAGLEKIKSIGPVYMVAGGVPNPNPDSVLAMGRLAVQLRAAVHRARGELSGVSSGNRLSVRAGIHVGPLVGAVLGGERVTYDVFGDTVNTASRMMSTCAQGCIRVTDTFAESLRNHPEWPKAHLILQGPHEVLAKGKGRLATYFLAADDDDPPWHVAVC